MSSKLDRRQFLAAGAASAAVAAAAPSIASAQPAAPAFQEGKSRWPLCLNMSTVRECPNEKTGQRATLDEKVDAAIEAGYDALELWINDLEDYEKNGQDVAALCKRIKDAGLFVVDVIGLWDGLPATMEEWNAILPVTKNRMRLAAAAGSKHIAVLPLPNRDNWDNRWATDRYRDLLNIGRSEFNIIPAFEYVSLFKTVPRMGQAAGIAIDANDPDACIIADTFHMHKGGSGFNGVRHMNGKFIASFHWNDVPAQPAPEEMGDKDRIYPGDGVLPLNDVLKQLADINYTGPLSLEIFHREYWKQDVRKVANDGLEKMKAQVAPFS